uniref:TonB family protein n=1 Tax=Pannus brasiliensis CCIBt3594 TaxID=1427578 RepID=A0AAW9QFM6_9CHRO
MTSFYLDSEIGQNKLVNSRNFAIAASIGIHGLLLASVVPNMARSAEGDPAPRDLKNVGVIELNSFERSRLPEFNPSPSNLPGASEIPGLPPVPGADSSVSPLPALPPLGSLDSDLPPISSISPPPSLPSARSAPSLPPLPPSYSSLPSSPALPSLRVYNPPVASIPRLRSSDISRPPLTPSTPNVPRYSPNLPPPPSVPTVSGKNPYGNNLPPNTSPVDNYSRNDLENFYRNNPNIPRSNRDLRFDPSGDPSLTAAGIRQAPIRASEQARNQLGKPVPINPATGNESPRDDQRVRGLLAQMEERRRSLQEDKTNTTDEEAMRNQVAWLNEQKNQNPEALNELNNRDRGKKGISTVALTGSYPADACSRQLAGTAVYGVTVNGAGVPVSEPWLLKSAGFPILNQQAAREVRSTRFSDSGDGSRIYQVKVSFAPSPDVCRTPIARPRDNEPNPIETRNSAPPAPEVQPPTRERSTNPRPNPEVNPRPENPEKAPAPTPPPTTVVQPKAPQPAPPVPETKPPQPDPAVVQPKAPQPAPPVQETKAPEPEGPPAPAAAPRSVEPAPEPPKPAESPAEAKPAPAGSPGSEG